MYEDQYPQSWDAKAGIQLNHNGHLDKNVNTWLPMLQGQVNFDNLEKVKGQLSANRKMRESTMPKLLVKDNTTNVR